MLRKLKPYALPIIAALAAVCWFAADVMFVRDKGWSSGGGIPFFAAGVLALGAIALAYLINKERF